MSDRENRIERIHHYCDRWCERCAFTERCPVYASQVAIGMCGDVVAGLELAIADPESRAGSAQLQEPILESEDATTDDTARESVSALFDEPAPPDPLEVEARDYTIRAFDWLDRHRDIWFDRVDLRAKDAFEVVTWDAALIGAKIHRALFNRGLPRKERERDAVQNDANGSAKVALISLERSEAGWRLLARAIGSADAAALSAMAAVIRAELAGEFPEAMRFVRPGFDE